MINLLPPDLKEEFTYGRRNTTLRRYAIALSFGLLGAAVIVAGGWFVMQKSITTNNTQLSAKQDALKAEQIDQTRAKTENITNDLKLAEAVLSREVLFSELLSQIAKVTPKNTALTNLSISQVGGAIDISAEAADITSATQLQVNLQDPANKIFSKADIQNITCDTKPAGDASSAKPYPCTVTLKALFAKDNPFLFINKGAKQ